MNAWLAQVSQSDYSLMVIQVESDASEMLKNRRHQAAYLSRYGSSPERSWEGCLVADFFEAYVEMNELVAKENGK